MVGFVFPDLTYQYKAKLTNNSSSPIKYEYDIASKSDYTKSAGSQEGELAQSQSIEISDVVYSKQPGMRIANFILSRDGKKYGLTLYLYFDGSSSKPVLTSEMFSEADNGGYLMGGAGIELKRL